MKLKCYKISCNQRPIIRFDYDEIEKDSFCLEHLVERLEYIIKNEYWHILEKIKKIIPIFNF